jgi:Glycerophosphoryl diester phosphodiesterase family
MKLLDTSTNWVMRSWCAAVCGCILACAAAASAQQPLRQAHAHNDYLHTRPLLDALDNGFCSAEADIFLVGDKLLVAHSRLELDSSRTLQSLYLDPLKSRIAQRGGRVHENGPIFWLLIDIKSDGESTYRALHEVLAGYREMLTRVEDGRVTQGAVQVVISGNRPRATIAAQAMRYCGIDGRLADLDSDAPGHLLPMISDNWTLHFSWRGAGPFPAEQRQKLRDIVARAHAKGRTVRFWATPELPELWKELIDAQVDLVNTDRLEELRAFLTK